MERISVRVEAEDTVTRFLLGTTNAEKIARIRVLCCDLSAEVVSPREIDVMLDVDEDGVTPLDNAAKKARAYLAASGLPTLSIDSGLYIDCLPPDLQPGLNVRRVVGRYATDDELLRYYQDLLRSYGGGSKAHWTFAAVFVWPNGQESAKEFTNETYFTCIASPVRKPGAPLSSLQIDPDLGKYSSETTAAERATVEGRFDAQISAFLRDVLLGRR